MASYIFCFEVPWEDSGKTASDVSGSQSGLWTRNIILSQKHITLQLFNFSTFFIVSYFSFKLFSFSSHIVSRAVLENRNKKRASFQEMSHLTYASLPFPFGYYTYFALPLPHFPGSHAKAKGNPPLLRGTVTRFAISTGQGGGGVPRISILLCSLSFFSVKGYVAQSVSRKRGRVRGC